MKKTKAKGRTKPAGSGRTRTRPAGSVRPDVPSAGAKARVAREGKQEVAVTMTRDQWRDVEVALQLRYEAALDEYHMNNRRADRERAAHWQRLRGRVADVLYAGVCMGGCHRKPAPGQLLCRRCLADM